jgi:hypothetical protein
MDGPRIRVLLILSLAIGLANVAVSGRTSKRTPLLPRPKILEDFVPQPGQFPLLNPLQPQSRSGQQTRPSQQATPTRPTIQPRPAPAAQPQQTASIPHVKAADALAQDQIVALVDQAIDTTRRRFLDVTEYTPWQIMHGILALRQDHKVRVGNRLVRSIDYVSSGAIYRGEHWFEKTPYGGRGHPFSVPYAFEGHINQFPALLCMSALPLDHKIKVLGGTITVADIVRNAQMTANSNEEVSWTLWFLTQYVSQDAEWINQNNQRWSMAELVRVQIQDPVYNAPCGGTHGLFALAFSRNAYIKQHGQLRGVWMQSEYKLRQHIELAKQLQNPDGSFSTQWFKGRGFSYDFQERIKTSGHMLEWLMMALPARRLEEAWVRRAVQNVATDLIRSSNSPVECGPMYHALHALMLYRERITPEPSTPQPEQLAAPTPPTTSPVTPAPQPPRTANTTPQQTSPRPQPATPPALSPKPQTPVANTPSPLPQSPSAPKPMTPPPSSVATTPRPSETGTPQKMVPPNTAQRPPMTAQRPAPVQPRVEPRPAQRPAPNGAILGRTPPPGSPQAPAPAVTPPASRPLLVLKQPLSQPAPQTTDDAVPTPPPADQTTQSDKPVAPSFGDDLLEEAGAPGPRSTKPTAEAPPPVPVRVSEKAPAPAEPKVQ